MGRSGRLLNQALELAWEGKVSYFITNIVQCRPTDMKSGPNRPPTNAEIWACRENLEMAYRKTKPSVVLVLGDVAKKAAKAMFPGAIHAVHPAFILRKGGTRSAHFRAFVAKLVEVRNAI